MSRSPPRGEARMRIRPIRAVLARISHTQPKIEG
jgi:hypothetical protein